PMILNVTMRPQDDPRTTVIDMFPRSCSACDSGYSKASRSASRGSEPVMIRSMSIGVFGLLSLICCLATTSALAQNYPCTAAICNFWVAAQGPGDPSSYFSKGAKKAQISAIKVGDTLTVNIEEIHVRSETPHAGWN